MILTARDASTLLHIGKTLGQVLKPPLTIFLQGDLGSGKTTFVRGVLRGCKYRAQVKSPSYAILESYHLTNCTVYHFDFYRIHEPSTIALLGIQEYWQEDAIFCVEWPDQAKDFLPPADLILTFSSNDCGRNIQLHAPTAPGKLILHNFKHSQQL